MTDTRYDIAVIPGDGIGPEVVAVAKKVLETCSQRFGFTLAFKEYPFGAEYYLKHKEVLPKGAFDDIGEAKAMLLGAVGDPRVPPGPLEQELLLALRFHFDQYLNLRPATSLPNVPIPIKLKPGEQIDFLIVRENTEDFYMNLGGTGFGDIDSKIVANRKLYTVDGKIELNFEPHIESAFNVGILTEPAIRRIANKAFQLARIFGKPFIHFATKSNALPHIYGFWDKVISDTKAAYPEIELKRINVDNLAYKLPRSPLNFGIILCPNLFGDIISDLVAGLTGGLGLAASGNIGDSLSMFEPVHGSAPDIAGTGKANPLAAIFSASMLLNYIGEIEAAQAIDNAVHIYLRNNLGDGLPLELGGTLKTHEVGAKVVEVLQEEHYNYNI
ncbi:MAG: isocitrate/isopropylmalate dehydrogenase family protein [Deltaproteobacteria bacterium]|jgi:3-isopropylmalate dehydrogenase|nr:isocitrate/isopropylmalate dehydrogenase family protein [Deltaproteobacteria bacterium]